VSQHGDPAALMNSINELFHGCGTNPFGDPVSENVNRSAFEGEFESRNNKEVRAGK
jgi:hypothetical protein